jgi:hypothetical protein
MKGRERCFNGATAMEPWKSDAIFGVPLKLDQLQWVEGSSG